MISPSERIIPALDLETEAEVEQMLTALPNANTVKIDCVWRNVISNFPGINFFVDEKYFDIPQTVTRKVKRLTEYPNITMCTVHGEKKVMKAAVEAAKGSNLKILSVLLLTSMGGPELRDFYNYKWQSCALDFMLERVDWAITAGCHGTICSAQEVAGIRKIVPEDFLIVVPGTRSDKVSLHDHKRSGSPRKAIEDGATHLVSGREILNDHHPAAAFARLVTDIS